MHPCPARNMAAEAAAEPAELLHKGFHKNPEMSVLDLLPVLMVQALIRSCTHREAVQLVCSCQPC